MSKGWVAIHRRLLNSDLWLSEKFTRGQAWVDLIMLANHKPGFFRKRGVKVNVNRGQVGHSVLALSDRWGWSRGRVRRFLDELETVHMIVQQKSNVTTLINIIKYESYQEKKPPNGTANGHQTDINNNDNNDNNTPHTVRQPITDNFFPDKPTIDYAKARQLPDACDQQIIDEFINTNQSRNWSSANWQSEYRNFLPKWKVKNDKQKQSSGRKLSAVEQVEAATRSRDNS